MFEETETPCHIRILSPGVVCPWAEAKFQQFVEKVELKKKK